MPRLPHWGVAFMIAASSADAQSIQVRTVEAQTGRPIAGAIVVLLDSAGRRMVQGLTDDLGRIALPVPVPGTYRLKADRIGHPGVLGDFFNSAQAGPVTLVMPAERFDLPEIAVTASTACGRGESEATARLWEEIRKALASSELTSSAESVELLVRRFVRYRSPSGVLKSDSTTRRFTTRVTPFVTAEPASLLDRGFIQGSDRQYRFLGPDAGFLLSDGFLETHCFRFVRAERNAPEQVGLGFEPVRGRKVPEIKGTLWVDRRSAELRSLAFEYVNVPSDVRAPGLGGRLEFERLASGAWIIRDWYLRMPDRVDLQRRPGARRAVQADTVVGFIDDGGTARPVGDATADLTEAAARTARTTLALHDIRLRVMSSAGGPIDGALVAVAERDTILRTGTEGRVQLRDVTGDEVRLRIRAIGHAPLSAVLTLQDDRRLIDTTLTLSVLAQQLDSIVVTERSDPTPRGKMAGFERRRKEGFGRFLTSEDLADANRGTLEAQLRRFGRINLAWCSGFFAAAAFGERAPANSLATCGRGPVDVCFMSIYMDGALYYMPSMPGPPFDASNFNVVTLQAVEVYRSPAEMPVEYNATGSGCGVILLWTK